MKRIPLNDKDLKSMKMTMYMGCEGGALFTAEQDGMFYVITDERAIASYLSEEDALDLADNLQPSALVFDSAQERDCYLMKKYGAGDE